MYFVPDSKHITSSLSGAFLCDGDTLDVGIETAKHKCVLRYTLLRHVSAYFKKPLSGELKTQNKNYRVHHIKAFYYIQPRYRLYRFVNAK